MPASQARVPTASASRYLQQVCKHWSHKFAVEFTPQKGRIPFADGRVCDLEATDDTLTMRAQAPDPKRSSGCSAWSWTTSSGSRSART